MFADLFEFLAGLPAWAVILAVALSTSLGAFNMKSSKRASGGNLLLDGLIGAAPAHVSAILGSYSPAVRAALRNYYRRADIPYALSYPPLLALSIGWLAARYLHGPPAPALALTLLLLPLLAGAADLLENACILAQLRPAPGAPLPPVALALLPGVTFIKWLCVMPCVLLNFAAAICAVGVMFHWFG